MTADLLNLIRYLLPGFLSAWIFYGLSAHQKPEQFERVIQALIFTAIVQAVSALHLIVQAKLGTAPSDATAEEILPPVYAILVGILFAWGANKDFPHSVLRSIRMTEQTSYPSEWFGVFSSYKSYVVLHLEDERRLYGWPKEWPQSAEKGHFFITQPAWLIDQSATPNVETEVREYYLGDDGVEGIMVSAKDVKWIEVMQRV